MSVEAQPFALAIRPGGDDVDSAHASPASDGDSADRLAVVQHVDVVKVNSPEGLPGQPDDGHLEGAASADADSVEDAKGSDSEHTSLVLCRRAVWHAPLPPHLADMPNEVLLHILGYLDVNDLLATSRTSHQLRCLCVDPVLHRLRRRRAPVTLRSLLFSPCRPSLAELMKRHIFLTHTTVVSRRLARSLVSIRLSRRLAARPPAQLLVERCVLPPECAPGIGHVSPALVARTRAVERERLKDGLRRWIGAVWTKEYARKCAEMSYIGRVWRLRRFWERVSRGEI